MKRLSFASLIPFLVLPLFLGFDLSAAGWKAGLARVKINPREPVFMAGYASRNKPSEGTDSDLWAKALVLEDGQGTRGVWVTSDVIGFRAAFADPLCAAITARTGLQRRQIVLNASHTHTGPALTGSDSQDFSGTDGQPSANQIYSEWLSGQVVELVARALNGLQPATLEFGGGVATFVMNRREFTERGVVLGVNPGGYVDRSVPVLKVSGSEGQVIAVVFGAACHNTTLGGRDYRLSGDFAGYAQAQLEAAIPGVQAMFMQGCAGDANPWPRGTYEIAREHGRTLGTEVQRVLGTRLERVEGPLTLRLERLDLPLRRDLTRKDAEAMIEGGGGWSKWVGGKMLEAFDRDGQLADHYNAPMAVWQFGDNLTWIGLSGESVSAYVTRLRHSLGARRLWVSAYCNDVFGYLPSAHILAEGGYETRGLIHGGVGLFDPAVEDRVVEALSRMALEAGRPKSLLPEAGR